jgi:23S rRNA (guanosine2251-2'-O)-methyltransferase
MSGYLMRQCGIEGCRFRYPVLLSDVNGQFCPRCGSETTAVSFPRHTQQYDESNQLSPLNHIELLLDNIRSVFNVGAMFRTADGAGVCHVHLCGITAPPTHPKIAKTALGAESFLPWSYANNGLETAVMLKQRGYQLWALEATPDAETLFSAPFLALSTPILLIVGNEKAGVDPAVLELCDRVFSIPMKGHKESLNVAVAFGIALYHIQYAVK